MSKNPKPAMKVRITASAPEPKVGVKGYEQDKVASDVTTVNLFGGDPTSDMVQLHVYRREDGNGTSTVPIALLDAYDAAREEDRKARDAILGYLRETGQAIPYPFPGYHPLARTGLMGVSDSVHVADTTLSMPTLSKEKAPIEKRRPLGLLDVPNMEPVPPRHQRKSEEEDTLDHRNWDKAEKAERFFTGETETLPIVPN